MEIKLPYDTGFVPLVVGEQNLEKIVVSHISEASASGTQEELVEQALAHPIGTPRLRELARGKKRVVLVTTPGRFPVKSRCPFCCGRFGRGIHRRTSRS